MKRSVHFQSAMPLVALTTLALAALAILPAAVRAQCEIVGPTAYCGSSSLLCGPDGGASYTWVLPNGSTRLGQCILANAPGTYTLRYVNPLTGENVGPCTHQLLVGGATASISGPSTGCTGQSLELCGPAGDFEYEWAGPNAFSASSACVAVQAAGTYELRVRPIDGACWSSPAQQAVTFSGCTSSSSCPRAAWWWTRQCVNDPRHRRSLSSEALNAIAACAASRSAFLDENAFCRTMSAHPRTLRNRARRQVAAVWANVCAGELGASVNGAKISLDLSAHVSLPGYSGSLAAWLAASDHQIAELEHRSERTNSVKLAYKAIIRQAWHINHGIGIGPVCGNSGASLTAGSTSSSEEDESEPLAAELMDDSEASLAFGAIEPNPFRSDMSMAYSVSTTAASDVSIGVYDVSGRLVRQLVSGSVAPGQYLARWNGHDERGELVRGGMYFILGRIGGETVQTRVSFVR